MVTYKFIHNFYNLFNLLMTDYDNELNEKINFINIYIKALYYRNNYLIIF